MIPAAYASLDLEAIRHNLRIAKRHAPDAKIMAVIKANAYGHGLLRVAATLQPEVDAVAVARADEGIRLRRAGFDKPVTVLEGFVCGEELDELYRHGLDAVIHAPQQIDWLEQRPDGERISVWLKVDTGMNRLGFKSDEVGLAYHRLQRCHAVERPIGLMTHLATADDLEDRNTLRQITRFNDLTRGFFGPRNIANSAGILGWQEALSDWVRPGIMLYGCSPFIGQEASQQDLRPVMSLQSRVIAVKRLAAGEVVGYGGGWRCRQDTRLGVIAIGYGDGYPRHARSGTPVLVNGRQVPLIGRVSMDMITVDLHSQPEAKPGDPVTLWGDGLPVERIAEAADTIPYTLLCGITQRVRIIERAHG